MIVDKLKKFTGEGTVFKYKDVELIIKPLKGKQIGLLTDNKLDDLTRAKKLITATLKNSYPEEEFNEDMFDDLELPFINSLLEKILEVNGVDVDKAKQEFLK